MKKMVAIVKQRYDNQRIAAGEYFNVRDQDIVLLKALGRVKEMPPVKAMSTMNNPELVPTRGIEHVMESVSENIKTQAIEAEQTLETVEVDEEKENDHVREFVEDVLHEPDSLLNNTAEFSLMLRERAIALGIRVDGRWSDARVQREIDEYNKKTYQHMSMRASE